MAASRLALCVALLIVLSVGSAFGQAQTTDNPRRFSDQVMQQLLESPEAAVKLLREQSALGQASGFPVFSEQFRSGMQQGGAILRTEFVGESKLGQSLLRHAYLVMQRQRPVHLQLTYYKAGEHWALSNLHFTSDWKEFPFR